MGKNLHGGKKHKKIKKKDNNILPLDIQSEKYIIGKVEKMFNKSHCRVKTMDGNNIEDIFCSMNNSVRFVKVDDLVLIYKYNTENHFIKRNNSEKKIEKKKSIIVTLLDQDKLNILCNQYHYPFIEDKEEIDENIIFEDDTNNNHQINLNQNEDIIDIDDI